MLPRAMAFIIGCVLASDTSISIGRTCSTRASENISEPQALVSQQQARLIDALRSKIALGAIDVGEDPYASGYRQEQIAAPPSAVCGIRFENDQVHYQLATFMARESARAAGFSITHFGACGTCSTLQDLAVYLERPDLTTPVRRCGFKLSSSASLTCLKDLKFSTACAKTWWYNLENTRHQCLGICFWSWIKGEESTRKDGSLNACLQCDEVRSGPVFKATAGRTRRNSGIRSSIARPDADIVPLIHDYVPGAGPIASLPPIEACH